MTKISRKTPADALKSESSMTEERKQRIAEIRQQLTQGTYEVSSESLATAILDRMLERGEARHRAA